MWQEHAERPDTRVLVATQAAMESAQLASILRDAGYSVHLAADTCAALNTLRTSAEPLIVVLDACNTRLLNCILCSRRLTHHHVYVVLAPALLRLAPECKALYARLTLFTVHVPFTRDQLLPVIAKASRCLPSAYPAAPGARHVRHVSPVSTSRAQRYHRNGAGKEQPTSPRKDRPPQRQGSPRWKAT